jgi:predicted ATPase/DNA-binding SARP family transcriptional activator
MDFRILGPLEVFSDGETLDLGGRKQRALLAMLLLDANRVVSRDRLIEALWDDKPPETALKALQVYVSQLRKVLGKDRLVTLSPGYLLRVTADELDLERSKLLREAGELDEALSLWRGVPLSDFSHERFAQAEIARLEELRLSWLEERIDRDLADERGADLVSQLEALVKAHPLRERLQAQLMLALYRAGRQVEALDVYQRARTALVQELGIEPGRPLRELHHAILNQDPALEVGRAAVPVRDDRRNGLPTGTVTLLFADVEGSTRLLYALGGERYRVVRERARELVRSAAAKHRGHEVDWAGDGVFLAFESARDAVDAATALQRSLLEEPWPPDAVVRLRIGIHTGEPELASEGYVGTDVHIAARICAAGHGGQVVVSQAVRDLVGDDPRAGISFRPLGRHRFKDIPHAELIFQLLATGLAESFPPLQTLGGATLPALHHRLVGRNDDLSEITGLLARKDVRLVTITGPGGAGKSRLALEAAAAAALERPVHLVGLAPITDPELVPEAIARMLGVRESPGEDLIDGIADVLTGTGTLLFLDNLEHLTPAARHIAALLHRVSDLDVMTTSRAPLRLSGEHVVPLRPLEIDDAATLLSELAAARGAVLHDDALASVQEICRRLDGLPLAIELVAARLVVLPPTRILHALDEGIALDMEGPVDLPERQRTLRATIDWSYGLLSDSQRELHGTLAVFAGGCTLDDARALAGSRPGFLADLEALVGWSLLRSDVSDGDVRLSMLETVREDALARVASAGGLEDLRRRHAERFLELAKPAEHELAGPHQAEWLERLENELDNVRAMLDWCFASGRVEDALRALSSLERLWRAHAHVSEARRWLSLGLGLADEVSDDVRAAALRTAAQQATAQSDWDAAVPLFEEAIDLFHECGRGRDEVVGLAHLSFVSLRRDEPEHAQSLAERALEIASELSDPTAMSFALMALGDVGWVRGDHERALSQYEDAVTLRRGLDDTGLVLDAVYNLGMAAFQGESFSRAREAFEEALGLAQSLGEALHIAAAQFMLADLDLRADDSASARERAREALDLYIELGDDRSRARCLVILAGAAAMDGSLEEAARMLGAADAFRADQPLDTFELPVVERCAPELESAFDERRLSELKREGRRLHAAPSPRAVVSSFTEE